MLYIIPTPIWNKEDITLRSLRLFKEIKKFICEDTRTLKSLLNMYEIDYSDKSFYSLTSFTTPGKLSFYLNILKEEDVALVSEAWTPWVSDPWKELVRICWENNIKFDTLPWACALVPAIVWAWFDTSNFVFLGFLPKKKWKQTKMKFIISSEMPVFIYESVHRVVKTLSELKALWFSWKVALFRELSKMFEQKECAQIDTILAMLSSGEIVLKGEFVIGFINEQ